MEEFYKVFDWNGREKIGDGTFGTVYKVSSVDMKMIVAVKQNLFGEVETYFSVKHEHNVLLSLGKHRNIIGLVGGYSDEHLFRIVMEWADGGTVQDEIRRRIESEHGDQFAAFTMEDLCPFSLMILDALQFMHSKGICHLDLKPENIVLFGQDEFKKRVPKLVDFGVAQNIENPLEMPLGNGLTMAPEVLAVTESNPLSGDYTKADMWSFGAVLFWMIRCRVQKKTPTVNITEIRSKPLPAKFLCFLKNAKHWSRKELGKFNHLIGYYLLQTHLDVRFTAAQAQQFILEGDFKNDGSWEEAEGEDKSDFGFVPSKG